MNFIGMADKKGLVRKSGFDGTAIVKLLAHRSGLAGHVPVKCGGDSFSPIYLLPFKIEDFIPQ
jgi:hypothetical protein